MNTDCYQEDQTSKVYDIKGEYIDNGIASTSQEQKTDNRFQQSVTIKDEVTDEKLTDAFNEKHANTSREDVSDNESQNTACDCKIFKPDMDAIAEIKKEDETSLNAYLSKEINNGSRGDLKPEMYSVNGIEEDLSLRETLEEKICSAGDHESLMLHNVDDLENKTLSNIQLSSQEICNTEFTYLPIEKYESSNKNIKSESAIKEDRFGNPLIRMFNKVEKDEESTKLDASIKTEIIKHEHNSTTDSGLDTFPPDGYHAQLQKINDISKEIAEEKTFFFRDAMRTKTEEDCKTSYQNETPSCDNIIQNESIFPRNLLTDSWPSSRKMCNKSFKLKQTLERHELIQTDSQMNKYIPTAECEIIKNQGVQRAKEDFFSA